MNILSPFISAILIDSSNGESCPRVDVYPFSRRGQDLVLIGIDQVLLAYTIVCQ